MGQFCKMGMGENILSRTKWRGGSQCLGAIIRSARVDGKSDNDVTDSSETVSALCRSREIQLLFAAPMADLAATAPVTQDNFCNVFYLSESCYTCNGIPDPRGHCAFGCTRRGGP